MATKILNKFARFEYDILETFEAGIELHGDEIKAVRSGRVNLKGSYARIFFNKKAKPELFLLGAHFHSITHDPYRTRKLLVSKKELKSLVGKLNEKRLTLLPLSLYIKKGLAKVELGLGRGKKLHDKREQIKKRDLEREARRANRVVKI